MPTECEQGSREIFRCEATDRHLILLCEAGATIALHHGDQSSSGPKTIVVPRIKATTHQWDGTGRGSTYSVSLVDRQDRYTVFQSVEQRRSEAEADADPEIVPIGGLTISSGTKTREFKCADDSTRSALEGIVLQPTMQ